MQTTNRRGLERHWLIFESVRSSTSSAGTADAVRSLAAWPSTCACKLAAEFTKLSRLPRGLAGSYNNPWLLPSNGKRPEAEEQYRNALAIWENLAADFPAVPDHRTNLAASHNNVGLLLVGLEEAARGKESSIRQPWRSGRSLAADFPSPQVFWSTEGNPEVPAQPRAFA